MIGPFITFMIILKKQLFLSFLLIIGLAQNQTASNISYQGENYTLNDQNNNTLNSTRN